MAKKKEFAHNLVPLINQMKSVRLTLKKAGHQEWSEEELDDLRELLGAANMLAEQCIKLLRLRREKGG